MTPRIASCSCPPQRLGHVPRPLAEPAQEGHDPLPHPPAPPRIDVPAPGWSAAWCGLHHLGRADGVGRPEKRWCPPGQRQRVDHRPLRTALGGSAPFPVSRHALLLGGLVTLPLAGLAGRRCGSRSDPGLVGHRACPRSGPLRPEGPKVPCTEEADRDHGGAEGGVRHPATGAAPRGDAADDPGVAARLVHRVVRPGLPAERAGGEEPVGHPQAEEDRPDHEVRTRLSSTVVMAKPARRARPDLRSAGSKDGCGCGCGPPARARRDVRPAGHAGRATRQHAG